uniref:Glutaredoxin domain-containing protein n=1 Tax=Opuntia streptacantha TaxID=393608 RepID=A0A7C9D7X2_OPUST
MGCSASRFDAILAKAIEDPSSISSNKFLSPSSSSSAISSSSPSVIPKTRSLSAPLVHHPALRKGDTQHLVCLTSSTYGSLIVVDKSPSPAAGDGDYEGFSGHSSPDSVINTWELMEGLEGEEEFNPDAGKDCKAKLLNSFDFNHFIDAQKKPISRLGLDLTESDESLKVKGLNSCDFSDGHEKPSLNSGSNLTDSVKKLSDSYVFVDMPGERVDEGVLKSVPNSKPLWKHLSEESLLSKMDPNVASSYQRALSAKKMGSDEVKRMTESMGSGQFAAVNKSVSSTPLITKSSSFTDISSKMRGPEEKIVLYFTSVRGIRKTYEDCCSVRTILRGFRVVVDEKDISMDLNYRKELQSALGGKAVSLPQLFVGGKHVGGADEVKQLHETGELERLLDGYPILDHGFACNTCGESRFIPCLGCNGSRKLFLEDEGRMRRCTVCNENGLIRCPTCSS